MSDTTLFIFDLNGTLGAIEIGAALGSFLLGLKPCKLFSITGISPKIQTFSRAQLLEFGNTISSWHATVTFYGQPSHIDSPPISEEITILFSALIYTVVQAFFANRVRILSGGWYLMALAYFLGLLRLIAHIVIVGLFLYYSNIAFVLKWRWLVSTSLSLDLAVDLLITASLCYCLWKLRSSDFEKFALKFDEIDGRHADFVEPWFESIYLTRNTNITEPIIESTILTSAASVIQIVLFMTRSDLVWAAFFIIQAKLFSNAMLASLNGRTRFRVVDNDVSNVAFGSSRSKLKESGDQSTLRGDCTTMQRRANGPSVTQTMHCIDTRIPPHSGMLDGIAIRKKRGVSGSTFLECIACFFRMNCGKILIPAPWGWGRSLVYDWQPPLCIERSLVVMQFGAMAPWIGMH
ncbi:hypothetical protein DFH07DRAFT_763844 [Mycena maculata]|uniref:DUF6534 domain-containing protein n=1 Tax=Mycena maculata TaxID=230809 RepID=A0AAD7KGZ7_9AGAR|nr:hypothetical protein DFH07DRAFT_763844 [Mycena maculata]